MITHVRKNDTVKVITGRDKGKTGKVLRILNKHGKVVVEKVNVVKRHRKATGKEPGGILEKEAPIHASNVMRMGGAEPEDKKPAKSAKKADKK